MKLNVYAIRDIKADVYKMVHLHRSEAEAKRAFQNGSEADGSFLKTNPEDFSLFQLGIFDDCTGYIESYKVPKYVMSVLKEKQEINA